MVLPFLIAIGSFITIWLSLLLNKRFSPPQVFSVFWGVQLLFSVFFLGRFINFSYKGLLYVLFLCISFLLGSLIIKGGGGGKCSRKLRTHRVTKLLVILIALAMAYPLISLSQNGFSLSSMFDIELLLEMSSEMSSNRYLETNKTTILSQVLLVFSYLAPLYGGYCYPLFENKLKKICLLTIFPSIVGALAQGVKMGFMTSVLLFLIGVVVSSASNNIKIVLNARKLLYIFIGGTIISSFLYLTMMFRIGQIDDNAKDIVNQKITSYTLGHLPCFDSWFSRHDFENEDLRYGIRTFYAISNFLGIEKREQGIYQERVDFGKNGFEGESNVYTAFRPLLEDFGLLGGLLFIFFMGSISRLCILNMLRHHNAFLSETILCSIYAYVLWSYVTSFYSYFSYIVAFLFFYILLHFTYINEKHKREAY